MNKPIFIASAVFFILASRPMIAADTSPEERAIRNKAKEFVDAYNQGNAESVAAHWTKDGEYAVGQMTVKGRDAIAKLYGQFLRANPGSKMDVKISSIRLLAPTVAIEQGTASVTGGSKRPDTASAYLAVHVKQGDKWLMASVRESELPTIQADRDLKELEWIVGKWTTERDGAQASLTCDWIAEKHFLRVEFGMHGKSGDLPGGTQIIGRNPVTGQIVSWFFSADGGFGSGKWQKDGSRWMIHTMGITADGMPTTATNVLYRADKNVASWQSANRFRGKTPLPDVKEVVVERVQRKD